MFDRDDTIVAIATPPGRGGIGVVRLSGPRAEAMAVSITRRDRGFDPRHATLTRVHGGAGAVDQAVVTFFPAPHSYTGDDVVEISAHGSQVLLQAIVEGAIAAGARLAEPGEFTLRAYLNGRIDLVQAEAVRDLVDAVTPVQARAAFDQLEGTLTARIREVDAALLDLTARLEASLDFPDEGYHFVCESGAASELRGIVASLDELLADARRGRLIREGAQVAIVGRPNAGKSSLFNELVGSGRAIVTATPGTTRDLVTETADIQGIPVTFVDTAGIRETAGDAIEAEGISRTRRAVEVAQVSVVVFDRSTSFTEDDHRVLELTADRPRVVVANKCDLPSAWSGNKAETGVVHTSARTGEGLEELRRAVAAALVGKESDRESPAVTNVRHAALLRRAREALLRATDAAAAGTPEEFVVIDVTEARTALEEVTGGRTPDDVLRVIFESFCIGK